MEENEVEGDLETADDEDEDEEDIGVSESAGDAGDSDETIEEESKVEQTLNVLQVTVQVQVNLPE